MNVIRDWAAEEGVSEAAIQRLERKLADVATVEDRVLTPGRSEAAMTSHLLLEVSARNDMLLLRNNRGAMKTDRGSLVRFGLGNESDKMNNLFKTGDWVGIYRRLILPSDVGSYIGQFTMIECKEAGWTYNPDDPHEAGQMNALATTAAYGGIAQFYAGGMAFSGLPANF